MFTVAVKLKGVGNPPHLKWVARLGCGGVKNIV